MANGEQFKTIRVKALHIVYSINKQVPLKKHFVSVL